MRILITAILLLIVSSTSACDICGCSVSGNTIGILPHYQRSFIGLRTFYQHFENVNPLYEDDDIQDYYLQNNLWGRIALGQRWQLIGVLPYRINHRTFGNQTLNGIGDVSLMSNYTIFNTIDSSKSYRHHLMVGTGLKLPTGDFMEDALFQDIPANFRLGTGSVDVLFSLVYTIQIQDFILSMNSNYQLTSTNSARDYRYGSQFNTMTYVAYQRLYDKWAFQPFVGISYEYINKDEHYQYEQIGTGGQATYSIVGVETVYQSLSLGVNWQLPLSQNYADGEIISHPRLMASIAYIF